jgi:hypothetical protein
MRIVAAVTLWSGLFPIACVMMLLYYPIALFVVRTNLLGRFEPGPPTKPLQYRFVFTIYLPIYLLLHLFFTYGIYSDVEVPEPDNLGSGLFPGFTKSHSFGSIPKATHSVCTIVAGLAVLILCPYHQRNWALHEGVLTPWEIVKVFMCSECIDEDFGVSARVSVGVHHLTTPAFFDRKLSDGDTPHLIQLPTGLSQASLYTPPRGLNLLAP